MSFFFFFVIYSLTFWRLLRGSLDLHYDFSGILDIFFCNFFFYYYFLEPFWLFWFERVNALRKQFLGSPLFFDRVHFISLAFHTSVSLYCSCTYFTYELYPRGVYLLTSKFALIIVIIVVVIIIIIIIIIIIKTHLISPF